MGKEYSKSATERGQFMIADAIRKLSGSSDESLEFSEFNKDATEYGQKAIIDAINGLSNGEGGSLVTVDTEITENSTNPVTSSAIYEALQNTKCLGFKINVTQSEHQTITYTIGGGSTSRFYTEGGIDATSEGELSEGGDFYEAFLLNIKITSENGYQYGNISLGGDGVVPSSFSIVNVGNNEISYEAYCFAGRTINLSATPATPV